MKTISYNYPELIEILHQKTPCVLATVIQTQGSTPQKAGSSALIGINKLLAGTVGGGMTELKVVQQAQTNIISRKSGIFPFELHGEIAKGSEPICGGSMTILLDADPKLHLPVFRQLKSSLEQHIKGVLVTWAEKTGEDKIDISRYWFTKDSELFFPDDLGREVELGVSEMLENPNHLCKVIERQDKESNRNHLIFLECLVPKPVLIIAGAGHIGQSLAHLGKFLGFEVTVWDDRPEYANKTTIPDADFVMSGAVDSSLAQIEIRNDSYLVLVTHGHKSDAEVLRRFIGSGAAYIGMIGSKAKVSQMRASFMGNGWATAEQWKRIFTPIGLDIGAQTVEEIALSIAAQLIQVRNQRKDTSE